MPYHDALQEKHTDDRKKTVKIVQDAIQTIKDIEGESAPITAKKIRMYSDLSRSVLYKKHIVKVWNPELWEKKYSAKDKFVDKLLEQEHQKALEQAKQEIELLILQLENEKREKNSLKEKLELEKERSKVYKADLEEEKINNQKLLGECHRLASELKARGFDV